MDPFVLKIFRHALDTQCEFALRSKKDLDAALSRNDIDGIFLSVQSLLVAIANVSRLLFGQGGKAQGRDDLHKSLQVDSSSPVAATKFRNHFEHMDERIEDWAARSKNQNFMDMNVGALGVSGLDKIEQFRHYDPQTETIFFWGQTYELGPVLAEIERLASLLP